LLTQNIRTFSSLFPPNQVNLLLNFQNGLDLFLSVLKSSLQISISNSASASLYVELGSDAQQLTIFDAELQLSAQAGYDLDMLKVRRALLRIPNLH
jgi:hypothetical protein